MLISTFLQDKLNINLTQTQKSALDQLAGQEIHTSKFYATLEDATQWYAPWMPLYFLPIGKRDFAYIGLHLRPEDVENGRLAIVQANNDSVLDAWLIEVADSLENYLYRTLLEWEAILHEEERALDTMEETITLANQLFGNDFYTAGRHDTFYPDDEHAILIHEGKAAPFDYVQAAKYRLLDQPPIAVLEKGIAHYPDCLNLYADLNKAHHKADQSIAAANTFVKSLQTYYHTSYRTNLPDYLTQNRPLQQSAPEQFDDLTQTILSWQDDTERLKAILAIFQAGDVALSAKLLLDLCYDLRTYEHPLLLQALQAHYERLNWPWAIQLITLRQVDGDNTAVSPSPEHGAFWEEIASAMIQHER